MTKYSNKEWAPRRYFWNQLSILYSVNLSIKYAMRRHVSINKPIFSGICAHFPMPIFSRIFGGFWSLIMTLPDFWKNGVTTLARVVNRISTKHGIVSTTCLWVSNLTSSVQTLLYPFWYLNSVSLQGKVQLMRSIMLLIEKPCILVVWWVNYVKAIKIFNCTF